MKVSFTQIYIEPGACFPFSLHFQRRISKAVSALVEPSVKFIDKFADDYELISYMSAKHGLHDNEIRGPGVFKKAKDVEYYVYLPFDAIMRHADSPRHALRYLLKGVCDVFDRLEIDKTRLLEKQDALIEGICSDPTMLADPSWDDDRNPTTGRRVFKRFSTSTGGRDLRGRFAIGRSPRRKRRLTPLSFRTTARVALSRQIFGITSQGIIEECP